MKSQKTVTLLQRLQHASKNATLKVFLGRFDPLLTFFVLMKGYKMQMTEVTGI